MTEGDRKRFGVLLFWLAERMLAPGGRPKVVDARLIGDYFEALRDRHIAALEWAAREWFGREKWFPMPCELRATAQGAPPLPSLVPEMPRASLPETIPLAERKRRHEEQARLLRETLDRLNATYGTQIRVDA